ncbi:VanZ family protein [Klenkia soli]|uniref:VanZ family protein n=1 Tax=Klenkia soli TaxID=1052260 RepID=UPI0013F4E1C7|nr:VanZ family protein [Klenkia soli]
MITNWVLDHPWANAVGMALLLLLGPTVGAWLADQPRRAWWAAALSTVPVAVLTMAPTGRRSPAVGCTVQWSLPDFGTPELMANVLLFALPAVLVTVASRRPATTLVGATVLSVGIEAVQAVAVDLGRACDTTDWLCNTLGAGLGVALGCCALLLHRRVVTSGAGGRGRARRAGAPGAPRPGGTAPSSPPARRG